MYLALVAFPVSVMSMMLGSVLLHYMFRHHHQQDHTHLTSLLADDDLKEEEFDPSPPADDMVDPILGDIMGQGEWLRLLLSWRDPRTSQIFVSMCLIIVVTLYVVPLNIVAVVTRFYYLHHPIFRDLMPTPTFDRFCQPLDSSDQMLLGWHQ
ncbi:hypothetical protein PR202_gb25633 [Eleusine coracana subsp. coracana]|uniref:Multiple C2 domain-containing protein n=1 Tax=Eleusine coracana subsp. coracana TaxID=191504 RepID=A0AAV5FPR1_ELECO|nr:hypothetical protein PR202_gb25633 [Eleusine coracana subsp. coracana]